MSGLLFLKGQIESCVPFFPNLFPSSKIREHLQYLFPAALPMSFLTDIFSLVTSSPVLLILLSAANAPAALILEDDGEGVGDEDNGLNEDRGADRVLVLGAVKVTLCSTSFVLSGEGRPSSVLTIFITFLISNLPPPRAIFWIFVCIALSPPAPSSSSGGGLDCLP